MRTTLVGKKEIADGTLAFYFSKPADFSYKAGQSVDLTLIGEPVVDSTGNSRSFSLASAPHEKDLMIACRMRDTAFKKRLGELPIGSEVVLDGPFGSFYLHERAGRPAVCIAGGIGITPFRSMVAEFAGRTLPYSLTLLYSNRTERDAAFLDELMLLSEGNRRFRVIPIFSRVEGRITETLFKQHIAFAENPIFYIAGPTGMVFAMRDLLGVLGVSPDDIRFEEFAGY
jgi:ferredoxin-NADP reductase